MHGGEYTLWFGPEYDWRAVVSRCVPETEFELELTKADEDWQRTRLGLFWKSETMWPMVNSTILAGRVRTNITGFRAIAGRCILGCSSVTSNTASSCRMKIGLSVECLGRQVNWFQTEGTMRA